ncbi:MAG: PEP-CTERM sorting domain-containing protein [Bryobacterales bacterium]|nr:PEP-CTERM sorting domain-containing protein [Bryobacterales bacterium]
MLKVTKDILVEGCYNGQCSNEAFNTGGITNFEQTFPQIGENTVPEPGTYALMGAGLIGLRVLRRRKA